MIRIRLDSVNIPLQGVDVGRLLQSRNHWRAAACLFAAAFLAVCAMGCGSDDGSTAGDGGASADGGTARDGGSTPDSGTPAGDGGGTSADGGASADAALPVSWTGVYAMTFSELSRTCATRVSLSFRRLRYVEGAPTASWEQPGVLNVAAEVARDFTWLRVDGWVGDTPGTRITAVTFTQGPPKTISGTNMRVDTVNNCTETYSVIGVRP